MFAYFFSILHPLQMYCWSVLCSIFAYPIYSVSLENFLSRRFCETFVDGFGHSPGENVDINLGLPTVYSVKSCFFLDFEGLIVDDGR